MKGVIGKLYPKDTTSIDKSQRELEEGKAPCKNIVMDARELKFSNESFQNVTFFYSLMFMDKEEKLESLKKP